MHEENITDSVVIQKRSSNLFWYFQLGFLALAFALVLVNSFTDRTSAYLSTRFVTVGSSIPGVVTNHNYYFDVLGTPLVGSIVFEYCSNSPLFTDPCTVPSGLNTAPLSIGTQSGETGFSVHPNTLLATNRVVLTRPPVNATPGPKNFNLTNITNPNASLGTTFVRIYFYDTTDGTGVPTDQGAVTFSIQNPLTVSVYVPPFLILCAGVTVNIDCTSTSGITVDMGELSKTSPNTATTQFGVATNSNNGYVTSMQGSTMTAGNQVIPPLLTQTTSQVGVGQFGINLRQNSLPSVGTDVVGNGTGVVSTNYATPNVFRFQNGDVLASSSQSTEFNRFTISYLVNIPSSQPAGRYASTLTVIATTTF